MTHPLTRPVFGNTFVTGGTGLLGAELVQQLIHNKESSRLICLVRDEIPSSRLFSGGLEKNLIVIRGDIRDQALMERILNEYDIDTVFHLAAQTLVGHANSLPAETLDVNIRGTWSLLDAIRKNQRVKATIIASSDKAYGNLNGESYDESFPLEGRHPYDVSKSCADLVSQTYAECYKLNLAITRCGNFFGPGDLNESRIFPHAILSLLQNKAPVLRSDGSFIRDYIYVGDGAAAYRCLARHILKNPLFGEAFNFSYGLRMTVLDVVQSISKKMNCSIPPIIKSEAKHEIPVQCLNSEKAADILKWTPEIGFDLGLEKTIEWYQKAFQSGVFK
jgi:CDP-glucose 4,6-dehydratase